MAVTVAAMAVAIAATAAVVTAAKARRDPSAAALLRRWRCWRALAAAALVTAAVGTASLAAAAFVTAEGPLEPPSQGVGGPRGRVTQNGCWAAHRMSTPQPFTAMAHTQALWRHPGCAEHRRCVSPSK